MNNFTFQNPTNLVFGKGSMNKLAELIKPFGNRILLIYGGGSIKKNGIYFKIVNELKTFTIKDVSGIEPNPRVETIRKALADTNDFVPDFVLAIGGGSVIDATKLFCASYYYDGDPWDF